MTERINNPTKRLRQYAIDSVVTLAGVGKPLTIKAIREDGYYELHQGDRLVITASPGHELETIRGT